MAQHYVVMAPADANAYDTLGLAYQMGGDYEKSVAAFAKALELNPAFEISRLHRAITWMQMGREHQALAEFLARAEAAPAQRARYWQLARAEAAPAARDRES